MGVVSSSRVGHLGSKGCGDPGKWRDRHSSLCLVLELWRLSQGPPTGSTFILRRMLSLAVRDLGLLPALQPGSQAHAVQSASFLGLRHTW